ncbi:MAG: sodium-dependent transporter, partial [Calditrichaeota bacterium]|nr:sodium-dependent transporter [Calditrichota bacterium]
YQFPFKVGEGGGAPFVIMYIIFCFVLCLPAMVTEIAIGRKTQRNAAGAYATLGFRKWTYVGKAGIFCGMVILSYYIMICGWVLAYLLDYISGDLDVTNGFTALVSDFPRVLIYSSVFMVITAFIVSKGIHNGIERVSRLLMPLLLILIVGLIVYALTLPNALSGLEFYLVPDFSKLTDLEVIQGALSQAFFSLSLGMGALLTYGSYVPADQNIVKSASIVVLADIGIAFLAGFMVFPFVFSQGIDPATGGSLLFETLPGIFATLGPVTGRLLAIVFFLLLALAALTSTISFLEVSVAYFVDEKKISRKRSAWSVAVFVMCLSIPSLLSFGGSDFFTNFVNYSGSDQSFMTLIGHVFSDSYLPLGGLLFSVFAAYVWKRQNLYDELAKGYPGFAGSIVQKYIDLAITVICPLILGIIFVLNVLHQFFGIILIH